MNAHRVQDDELHAYVDGQLDGNRRLAVERWLAADPEAAHRAEAYRQQMALLHEIFDPVLREAASEPVDELTHRLQGRLPGNDNAPPWHGRAWVRAAAAVVLVVAGAAGGFFSREALVPGQVAQQVAQQVGNVQRQKTLQTFAEEAAQAHRFYTADERFQVEMGAEDQGALDSFLSQRVGKAVFGPDLSKVGFRLIGGRSLPTDMGAGAQYMYSSDQGRRITLFVGSPPAGQETSFSFAQHGDVATFYWVEGSLAYALIGRLSKEELMGITKAVYEDVKAGKAHRDQQEKERRDQQQARPPEQGGVPQQNQTQTPPEQNPVQPVSDTQKPKNS